MFKNSLRVRFISLLTCQIFIISSILISPINLSAQKETDLVPALAGDDLIQDAQADRANALESLVGKKLIGEIVNQILEERGNEIPRAELALEIERRILAAKEGWEVEVLHDRDAVIWIKYRKDHQRRNVKPYTLVYTYNILTQEVQRDRVKNWELNKEAFATTSSLLNNMASLDQIKANIAKYEFLQKIVPFDVLDNINKDPVGQQFTINTLFSLVSYYAWIMEDPQFDENRDELIKEVENDICKPLFECLDTVSGRLVEGDLVPDSVTLNLSDKDTHDAKIDLDRKAKIAFLPMKGDPWHWGHVWVVLRLLADGYDQVVIMVDIGEPELKPNLTALPIREADSAWLFDALNPFIGQLRLQREIRPFFDADGETVYPKLILTNKEVSSDVEWTYIAGFDHMFLTYWNGPDGKEVVGRSEEDKIRTDVIIKLVLTQMELLKLGVGVGMQARFNKRASDASLSTEQGKIREKSFELVCKLYMINFFTQMVKEQLQKEEDNEFWSGLGEWIETWQAKETEAVKVEASKAHQWDFVEECLREVEFAFDYLDAPDSEDYTKVWFNRYYDAREFWDLDGEEVSILDSWFNSLREAQSRLGELDIEDSGIEKLIGEFNTAAELAYVKLEMIEQPMDISSTGIRERGEFYGLPREVAESIQGMRRYTSCQVAETTENDKVIAAEVLADIVDLRLLPNAERLGYVTEEMVLEHFGDSKGGKLLATLVDTKLLAEKITERLSGTLFNSVLYYGTETEPFEAAMENMRISLENAYGSALHAVDMYLMKFLVDEKMSETLINTAGTERKAIDLLDIPRGIIEERAAQIIAESREGLLDLTQMAGVQRLEIGAGIPRRVLDKIWEIEKYKTGKERFTVTEMWKDHLGEEGNRSTTDREIRFLVKAGILKQFGEGRGSTHSFKVDPRVSGLTQTQYNVLASIPLLNNPSFFRISRETPEVVDELHKAVDGMLGVMSGELTDDYHATRYDYDLLESTIKGIDKDARKVVVLQPHMIAESFGFTESLAKLFAVLKDRVTVVIDWTEQDVEKSIGDFMELTGLSMEGDGYAILTSSLRATVIARADNDMSNIIAVGSRDYLDKGGWLSEEDARKLIVDVPEESYVANLGILHIAVELLYGWTSKDERVEDDGVNTFVLSQYPVSEDYAAGLNAYKEILGAK